MGTRAGLIDCDVHPYLSSLNELCPYMDESLQRLNIGKYEKTLLKSQNNGALEFPAGRYANPNYVLRLDALRQAAVSPDQIPIFLQRTYLTGSTRFTAY